MSFNKAEKLLLKGIEISGGHELLYTELCHLNVQYINNLLKDPNDYPEILKHDARAIARNLIEKFAKNEDDSICLVIRV